MLKLWLSAPVENSLIWYIDNGFQLTYKEEWLQPQVLQDAVLKIDKTKYLGGQIYESPILGMIPPGMLSGSVKLLIMAYNNPDEMYPIQWMGDNCAESLKAITDVKDINFTYQGARFEFVDNTICKLMDVDGQPEVDGKNILDYMTERGLYHILRQSLHVRFSKNTLPNSR